MIFIAFSVIVFLLAALYSLTQNPIRSKLKTRKRVKEFKEEHGEDALSQPEGKVFLAITQILGGLWIGWQIIVFLYLVINHYLFFFALAFLLYAIWQAIRLTTSFSKEIKKFFDDPDASVHLSIWRIIKNKLIALIEIVFYLAVLAKIFGFDVSQLF